MMWHNSLCRNNDKLVMVDVQIADGLSFSLSIHSSIDLKIERNRTKHKIKKPKLFNPIGFQFLSLFAWSSFKMTSIQHVMLHVIQKFDVQFYVPCFFSHVGVVTLIVCDDGQHCNWLNSVLTLYLQKKLSSIVISTNLWRFFLPRTHT